ncbi:MAG TPA: FprA family A-type flavoprotein [Armatimonadota bacterium]
MSVQIADGVHWVGALDPDIRVFDVIMAAPHGTTYNAYLVRGSEKTALIETVKAGFEPQLYQHLEELVDTWAVDYLVLNHCEPDHTGALAAVLDKCGGPQVLCSKSAKLLVGGLLHRDVNPRLVGSGDTLELGGKTLEFIQAPFLHWPDTMFTYLQEDRILFPCDFLGAHFADERLFNDLTEEYAYQFEYYFNVIFRPFKSYVLKGLEEIDRREVKIVCPSHGPILRQGIPELLAKYRSWAQVLPGSQPDRLLVFYASSYGNTRRLAEELGRGAEEAGARVSLLDLSSADLSAVTDDLETCGGVAVGSLTINGDAVKPVWDLLSSLATLNLRGKLAASFGSFGWSGEAPRFIASRLADLKMNVVGEPATARLVPTDEDLQAARALGAQMAQAMLAGK